jgi:cytochrome bd-I ubiquinol oxidase subunit X
MWYFCWILGIGVALGFGVINGMWLETTGDLARMRRDARGRTPASGGVAARDAASAHA